MVPVQTRGQLAVDQLVANRLTDQFGALRALATRVINEHVNDRGLCAVCGCAFPCKRAGLAEHNLALLGHPRSGRTGDAGPQTRRRSGLRP